MSDPVKPDGAGGTPNTAVKQPWENLGFESFEAYSQSQSAEVEKLRKQAEEKQAMIDRQANELGQLRKTVPQPVTPPATQPPNTPPANTPEADGVTQEAMRTLRELAITMPAEQTAKVDEALNKAPANITEMVANDPQSRLVFMRNVLGDEFQLPKPKRSIFDGILPAPERKPLHEQMQEFFNKQNNTPSGKPYPNSTAPRTAGGRESDTPPEPSADRYRSALAGGLAGFRAALEADKE